jgi:hypothetical protein
MCLRHFAPAPGAARSQAGPPEVQAGSCRPVLLVPGGGRGSFDARGATVIPGAGTVYFGAYHMSGDWGTLDADKVVLVASDSGSRRLPAPVRRDETTFSGDGWSFKTGVGWMVREGARRGDYEVVRRQQWCVCAGAEAEREARDLPRRCPERTEDGSHGWRVAPGVGMPRSLPR